MVVLGGVAVSYERGTPVVQEQVAPSQQLLLHGTQDLNILDSEVRDLGLNILDSQVGDKELIAKVAVELAKLRVRHCYAG